ncbi:hypothetical protein P8452_58277 [Trifolium repens]|nr:hypothetical protein P8452_58277 [Trifolium repens]
MMEEPNEQRGNTTKRENKTRNGPAKLRQQEDTKSRWRRRQQPQLGNIKSDLSIFNLVFRGWEKEERDRKNQSSFSWLGERRTRSENQVKREQLLIKVLKHEYYSQRRSC